MKKDFFFYHRNSPVIHHGDKWYQGHEFHKSYSEPKENCEYGYGKNQCENKVRFIIPAFVLGFPTELNTCKIHIRAMTSMQIGLTADLANKQFEKDEAVMSIEIGYCEEDLSMIYKPKELER